MAEGKGHYVGCVLNNDNFDLSNQEFTWPDEGDDMFLDYFNSASGFQSGEYAGPYHGISLGSDVQEHLDGLNMGFGVDRK